MDFTDKNKLVKILKGSHVADIDRKCMDSGMDLKLLMSNAGTRISDFISSSFEAENKTKSLPVTDDLGQK
ncbi:MAG: hypothetical protein WCJ54_07705, partial [Actinomycetota bacterium]